jgi:hypothetical protein
MIRSCKRPPLKLGYWKIKDYRARLELMLFHLFQLLRLTVGIPLGRALLAAEACKLGRLGHGYGRLLIGLCGSRLLAARPMLVELPHLLRERHVSIRRQVVGARRSVVQVLRISMARSPVSAKKYARVQLAFH